MHVCVFVPTTKAINNWWHDIDSIWLVKQVLQLLYCSCAIIGNGLSHKIEACHRNQPCKTDYINYHFISRCFTFTVVLHVSNKTESFSYRGGCGVCGCCKHIKAFKEELAWTPDKCIQVINDIMLFKTVMPLRN